MAGGALAKLRAVPGAVWGLGALARGDALSRLLAPDQPDPALFNPETNTHHRRPSHSA